MRKTLRIIAALLSLCLAILPSALSFAAPKTAAAKVTKESPSISKSVAIISTGEVSELKVNGTSRSVNWKTVGKGIAAVNKSGRVIGVNEGYEVVTAQVGSETLACVVKVEKPMLSRWRKTLYVGEKSSIKIKNTVRRARWLSSDSSVVRVDQSGNLTALRTGSAKIIAAVGKSLYTCKVDVQPYRTIYKVPYLNQNEVGLPTGCESVSTVMALRYLGVKISTDTFVDKYLYRTDSIYYFNPYKEFGGDPRTEKEGIGCYSTAIERSLKKLIKDQKLKLNVTVLKNVPIDTLCKKYISNNIPVVFWATNGMQKPRKGCEIYYNNKKHRWISPCHCLLLVGCDGENYIFHDPLTEAYQKYPRTVVETAYKGMKSQALVITKK